MLKVDVFYHELISFEIFICTLIRFVAAEDTALILCFPCFKTYRSVLVHSGILE